MQGGAGATGDGDTSVQGHHLWPHHGSKSAIPQTPGISTAYPGVLKDLAARLHKNPTPGWCLGGQQRFLGLVQHPQCPVPHTAGDNCTGHPSVLQTGAAVPGAALGHPGWIPHTLSLCRASLQGGAVPLQTSLVQANVPSVTPGVSWTLIPNPNHC